MAQFFHTMRAVPSHDPVAGASRRNPAGEGLACARCGTPVPTGRGQLYAVRIDALSDPTPMVVTEELLDQSYRRRFFSLCVPCDRTWIENPFGETRSPSGTGGPHPL